MSNESSPPLDCMKVPYRTEGSGVALAALEQMRQPEGGSLAIAWPCFWYLNYYSGFHRVLRERFRLENDIAKHPIQKDES